MAYIRDLDVELGSPDASIPFECYCGWAGSREDTATFTHEGTLGVICPDCKVVTWVYGEEA